MFQNIDDRIYTKLKVIANKLMAQERNDHTLSATDLVHEAYIKLQKSKNGEFDDAAFLYVLARQMRRLLVDYGRHKSSLKRGAGLCRVIYTDDLGIQNNTLTDFSIISNAIDDLEELDNRAAKAIDLFYFTNISKQQAAEVLQISVPTLERDLRFAKAHISYFLSEHS